MERQTALNISKEEGDKDLLLMQHHQFIEDTALDRENQILKEIRQIYCSNLVIRRYLTLMLADSNGLMAATANNFPKCHRLKSLGNALLIQKCAETTINISAKNTSCGAEPYFNNQTIGKDGYSLHPFVRCFWPNGLANLNGKIHSWNGTEWTPATPNFHFATLRLIDKFNTTTWKNNI